MKNKITVLLIDAVINVIGFIVCTVFLPILLILFTPSDYWVFCMVCAAVLEVIYAYALKKMQEKATQKCGARFAKYTLCSILPAVFLPLAAACVLLIEQMTTEGVSYHFDLFFAIIISALNVVLMGAYLIFGAVRKKAE